MVIIKFLLIASILSLVFGQLLRLPLFLDYGAINLTDLLIITLDLTFFLYMLTIKKSLILSKKVVPAVIIFTLWVITTNILSLRLFDVSQISTSTLFLIRFLGYFLISQVVLSSVDKGKVINWLHLILFSGLIFTVLGFLQLIIFPNLSFLTLYGWDPHQKRIVSTILDPNFAGLIFIFIFVIATCLFLFSGEKNSMTNKNKHFYIIISAVSLIAIIFTLSRSSYLALITVICTIGVLKSPKMLLMILVFLLVVFATIPQVRSRVIGAVTIDETSQARLASWRNALTLLSYHPLFGVGFNNYRFAQAKYQLFDYPEQIELHSASGSDSSILLVAATAGVIGLILFLMFIFAIFASLSKKIRYEPIKLIALTCFLALLVHSQFVNSFFFPQVAVLFWFIFGLSQTNDI